MWWDPRIRGDGPDVVVAIEEMLRPALGQGECVLGFTFGVSEISGQGKYQKLTSPTQLIAES
jgi:hypothetical protein